MTLNIHANRYSRAEEIASSIVHGVGILLSIVGLGVMTSFSSMFGNVWHIVSTSIYSGTQILLYTASTLGPLLSSVAPGGLLLLLAGGLVYTVGSVSIFGRDWHSTTLFGMASFFSAVRFIISQFCFTSSL